MNNAIKLCDLKAGYVARVVEILPENRIRERLFDLGLTKNTEIKCLFNSPTGGMRAYLIRGACVALRDEDAATVLVDAANEVDEADEVDAVDGVSGASGGIGNGID